MWRILLKVSMSFALYTWNCTVFFFLRPNEVSVPYSMGYSPELSIAAVFGLLANGLKAGEGLSILRHPASPPTELELLFMVLTVYTRSKLLFRMPE